MISLWSQYYQNCVAIMFVINSVCPEQMGSNCVQLMRLLKDDQINGVKEIAIIVNKIDLIGPLSSDELIETILLPEIINSFTNNHIKLFQCSSKSGHRIDEIKSWINDISKLK